MKEAGDLALNLNRVPCLHVDGVAVGGSSKAIERYLAAKLSLYGASAEEACKIDSLCEHIRDVKDSYQKAKTAGTADAWLKDDLPTCVLPASRHRDAPAHSPLPR